MLTFNEAPWIEYLEIEEETGKRVLKNDTPKEVRDMYEAYCKERNNNDDMLPK